MDLKLLATVFVTVFLAEMADKTQIATLLYASNAPQSRLVVFLASAAALTVASAIAVFAGATVGNWINERLVGRIAGAAFILIGVLMLVRSFEAPL